MKRVQDNQDMPTSTTSFHGKDDQTTYVFPSLLEAARRHGVQDDDPIMPLIITWQGSMETLRTQLKHLDELYTKTQKEITQALNQRTAFSEKEADRLKALAATLQVQMVCDIGTTIARESEKALTKRVKILETTTVRSLAVTLLLSVIVTYSFGHWRGYNAGTLDKQREADVALAELRLTETESEKLFSGKPKELELWAPIIRLNRLGDTHSLDNCYKNTFFNFGGFADQLGCWLPVRIPVRHDHPRDMPIPLPAPKGPPLSEDVWR
ncbi:hypothetical protein AB2M16_09620 [Acetobacter oryzifermentans]|uniref:hypothetical protein n=1 Tax=Acetobacter oryzifermentans TaxID=1633874 RepID=UPI003463A685